MLQRFSPALLIIALAALPAKAQTQLSPALAPVVLLDQQPILAAGVLSDNLPGGAQVAAENFVQPLPLAPTGITEITIWGIWFPSNTPGSDDWTVIIHQDDSGFPGNVLYTQANGPATSIVNTGRIVQGIMEEHMVTFDISPDLLTPPGTYWAEIYHNAGQGDDFWDWNQGTLDPVNGIPGIAVANQAPGTNWISNNFNLAIQINGDDAVPVELISFSGTVNGADVALNWETASETNNAGFEVQMQNSEGWNALGWIEGHGTTTEAQTYSYTATDLGIGTQTFRLKQIDFDGVFEYHGNVEATIETPGTHQLSSAYPNPFNPQTVFSLSVASTQHVRAEAFDALGRRVAVLFDGAVEANTQATLVFDAAGLPSGLYVVRVTGERFAETRAVSLLR